MGIAEFFRSGIHLASRLIEQATGVIVGTSTTTIETLDPAGI